MRAPLLTAWFLALALPAPAAQTVMKCPQGTTPTRTVDSRLPWVCALSGRKNRDGIDCPAGSHSVTTADVFDPFKCAIDDMVLRPPRVLCPPGEQAFPSSEPDKEFECRKTPVGFTTGPNCPKGTRPVPTPGQLRPFRCFADEKPAPSEPSAEPAFPAGKPKVRSRKIVKDCPKGMTLIKTEDPFEPVRCEGPSSKPSRIAGYSHYHVPAEVSFDYPKGWHLTDAWGDEVPSAYLQHSAGRNGKPVSLMVTRQRHGTPSFQGLSESIEREKQWHKAEETGRGKVSGFDAVFLGVPKESDTAFIDTGDGYFVLSYSAPPELYETYLPAYRRLVKSLRVRGSAR